MIGTPFENHSGKNDNLNDKYLNKKRNKDNNIYALNDKGKKLFHGAFTGGFSAGYFNTVGSKEGWKPNINLNYNQTIEDFMDDEDYKNAHIENNKSSFNNCNNNLILNNSFILNNDEKKNLINEGFCDNDFNYVEKIICVSLNNYDSNYGIGFSKSNNEMNYRNKFKNKNNIIKMNELEEDDNIFSYQDKNFTDYNFEEVYEKKLNKNNENRIEFVKSKNKIVNENIYQNFSKDNYIKKNNIIHQFESVNKLINQEKEIRDKINLENLKQGNNISNNDNEDFKNNNTNIEYNSIQLKILKEKKRFENQQKRFQKFSNPIQLKNNQNNCIFFFNNNTINNNTINNSSNNIFQN